MNEILHFANDPNQWYTAADECALTKEADEKTGRAPVQAMAFRYAETTLNGIKIKRTALDESLAARKKRGQSIPMLLSHNHEKACGVWDMWDNTATGLNVTGYISTIIPEGMAAHNLVKEGIIQAVSIGFRSSEREFQDDLMIVHKAELGEISLVTTPMQSGAHLKKLSFESLSEQIKRAQGESDKDDIHVVAPLNLSVLQSIHETTQKSLEILRRQS